MKKGYRIRLGDWISCNIGFYGSCIGIRSKNWIIFVDFYIDNSILSNTLTYNTKTGIWEIYKPGSRSVTYLKINSKVIYEKAKQKNSRKIN